MTRPIYEATVLTILGILVIVAALTSCQPVKVETSGTINHEVSVNLDEIEKYFAAICDNKDPGEFCYYSDVSDCTACMMADFLDKIGG